MSRVARATSAVTLLLAAAGHLSCTADSFPRSPFQELVSNGIAIRATDGEFVRSSIVGTVDTIPDLDLGARGDPEANQFHRIVGITTLADGVIGVLDRSTNQIRLYEQDGKFLRALGGLGDGPGEFRVPKLVPSNSQRQFLVYDHRMGRFTRLDLAGNTIETSRSGFVGEPVGSIGNRVLMQAVGPVPLGSPRGQSNQVVTYRIIDPFAGTADTIGTFAGRDWYVGFLKSGAPTSLHVPFDVMPSASVSLEEFVIAFGEDSDIIRYDVSGRKQLVMRLHEDPKPADTEALDAYSDRQPPSAAPLYAEMRLPESLPVFVSLLVDRLGWLWAETYRIDPDGPKDWILFDPDGWGRGRVRTPERFDPFVIGRDHVIGRWRDELDVEHVRRYRLHRVNALQTRSASGS